MRLKVRGIGAAAGIVIPKPVLRRLGLAKGDTVFLIETADGFRVVANDPEFEEQMTLAERVMKKRREMLRELAKS